MSKGARITLAMAALFFGTCFLLFAPTSAAHRLPAGPLPFYALAAVCYAVATVCLFLRSRVLTLLMILAIFGAVLWLANPNADVGVMTLPAAGLAGFLLLAACLYFYFRLRDRVWIQASRLANEGDIPSALAMLKEHLLRNGPSARSYNRLALLHALGQHWEDALHMAEEAERMGGSQPGVLGTKGLALWKLGRAPEALSCLEAAANAQPNDLISACNYGSILAESGRAAEASNVLKRAERLFADQIVIAGTDHRQLRQQALENLRRKVAESLGRT